MPPVLGVACGASFVAALQPVDRVTPELDGNLHGMDPLDVPSLGWVPAHDGLEDAGDQPAVPVCIHTELVSSLGARSSWS
jgi:hypothetical protein